MEQQGGRFLERSRKDGFWYIVPYKRAVDKTSQGLRERERDDEGGTMASVPHQFTGERTHKLSDLADVAIAHATRADGLPRSASEIGTSKSRSAPPTAAAPAPPRVRPAPPPAAPVRQTPQAQSPARTERDVSPLPPTMEPRQSSMFRLLKDTKLLPAESALILGPNRPTPVPNTQHAVAERQAAAAAAAAHAAAQHDRLYPQTPQHAMAAAVQAAALYGNAGSPYGHYHSSPQQAAAAAAYMMAAAKPAPALTRLTSQVSDWLNSFWPVQPRAGEGSPPVSEVPDATSAPAPAMSELPRGVAPPIVTIPPPEPPGPIQINTIPPLQKAENPKGKETEPKQTNETTADKVDDDDEKVTESLSDAPPLLDASRPSMAPTELEHSVSATLLKLASTPSKFFSGISALFVDDDEAKGPPRKASPVTTMTTSDTEPPVIAGTKRSKASLLDDDEEDKTMPTMGTKKRRTSLLDDYEDSEVDARMRTVYK